VVVFGFEMTVVGAVEGAVTYGIGIPAGQGRGVARPLLVPKAIGTRSRMRPTDGYDTVEWAAALPHSNGKVGMFGGSYVGATQMLAAIAHPPHLAGICPVVTASNYHENWTYQGGAFEQWFNESWTSGLAQDTLNRYIRENTNARVGATVLPLSQYPVFNISPPQNAGALTEDLAPYFLDWLAHPAPTTTTGSSGRSKRIFRTFRFPRSPSLRGTTSSRAARCATTWASKRTEARRRHAAGSASWSPSAATREADERSAPSTSVPPPRTLTRTTSRSSGTTTCSRANRIEFATGKPVQDICHGQKRVAR
jgi:hypothetical protein